MCVCIGGELIDERGVHSREELQIGTGLLFFVLGLTDCS